MPSLIIERGPERGQIIELPSGSRFVIGREEGSDIQITDIACSRRHCGLIEQDGVVLMKDLGSTHGTTVNGKQVEKKRLKDGDVIGIGETLFSFMAESRDADLVGRVVGGYKIHGRIGRGGMGTVYRGHQVALDREVALKVLSGRYSEDTTFINRFFKEAQAAARLNHPNVVQVYDVREEGGLYFISLEMMDRGTVQDLATEQGQLPISRVLEIARDAARGLVYAEKQKIVHGDIKPDNLMINSDAHIKISDLGLARDAGDLSSQGEEGIFGTPHFIAPEQALGKRVDTRSDIYSLGATLYRLVSGRTPHDGKSVQEIVLKQINTNPTDIVELRPDCPKDLRDLISVMMAKEPEDRFENASDLLNALELLGDSGRIKSATGVLVPMAIAVLVIAAGIGMWWLQREDETNPDTTNPNGDISATDEGKPVVDPDIRAREGKEALAAQQRALRAKNCLVEANTRKLEIKQQGAEENIEALTSLITLYEEVVAADSNSEDATTATTEIKRIQTVIESIQRSNSDAAAAAEVAHRKAEETYLQLEADVDAAIKADAFGSALSALVKRRAKLVKTQREGDLRKLSDRIMQGARQRSDSLHGSADRCVQSGDFDGARDCIRTVTKNFNPTRNRAGIFAELESLVKLAEAQLTTIDVKEKARAALNLSADQTRSFEALKNLYTNMKTSIPGEAAANDLANVRASLQTSIYKAQLAPVIEDLLAANTLKGKLDAILKSNDAPSVRLYGVRGLPTGKLIAADSKTVTVEQRNGSPKIVPWSDIDPETAVRQIFRRAAITDEDRVSLLHLCLLLGQIDQAEKTLGELGSASGLDALRQRIESEVRAAKLLARIEELKKTTTTNKMSWFELNDLIQTLLQTCRGSRALILVSNGKTPLVTNP